ncbi:MAG TPA: histidine kinase, partial [Prolixibacteraceae bacterium]|nr:histidine kinase [Prolixibacteraceae bacterium]
LMKYIGSKTINIRIIELIVFVVIWMAIFSIPFFNQRLNNAVNWEKVSGEWIRIFSYLIIFVVNTFLLVPRFLFQKKYTAYIGLALFVTLLMIGFSVSLGMILAPSQPMGMPPMDLGPGMPPMELGSGMPAPMGYRPVIPQEEKSIFMIFTDELIISLLVIGAGTSFKMVAQWLNEESRRKDIEKEQLKTELAFLRHQVSPHFFMNTLNNIHALIDINAEDAKNTIIELSTMMRYLLYDTAQGQTTLKKEIKFIESYISLMQLRFPKKVAVTLDVPKSILDIQIPPMLFLSFLENAFKHGVSYQTESFVSFKLQQIDNRLSCTIKNSKHCNKENLDKSYSGIGLTNIKQSLKLLFGNDYLLNIHESDKEFEVQLTIPIYENKVLVH